MYKIKNNNHLKDYKIKVYTYDCGIYDYDFQAISDEEANVFAEDIFFSFDNGWWWEYVK